MKKQVKRNTERITKDQLSRLLREVERTLELSRLQNFDKDVAIKRKDELNCALTIELQEKYRSFRWNVETALEDLRDRMTKIEEMSYRKKRSG